MTMTNTTGTSRDDLAPSERSGAPVALRHLRRRFSTTTALDGFSLDLEPGEFVALLGPSGCGKTTALRVLAGFETPDEGSVWVDGADVTGVPAQRRDMGMVFQSYSLFPNLSAHDNVAFGLRLRKVSGSERRRRANELLELVGLAEHRSKFPHQLSGGQQQRVALARALAIEPRVLLLDEPLSALDAKVRAELRDQIRFLQRRLSITTLFVTHDQEEALSMADRVGVMYQGRAEQIAAPAELYARPETPFVAEFVGITSRVPATRRDDTHVELLGRVVPVRGHLGVSSPELEALLRPEDLTVRLADDGPAVIVNRSFLGSTTRLEVALGSSIVKVDVAHRTSEDLPHLARVDLEVVAPDVLVSARR